MSLLVSPESLPKALNPAQAVSIAYGEILTDAAWALSRELPVLMECDKELIPYLFLSLRDRLKIEQRQCLLLDGRADAEEADNHAANSSFMQTMLAQMRHAVRGALEKRVVVLPHLDLLTTSQGGLSTDAREVIPLLYENPEVVWLGFRDPSFPVPRVIENLFPKRYRVSGVPREKLALLVTEAESRKFGETLDISRLYQFVSGMNAVRLRRMLTTFDGEDFPANPDTAYRQIRQTTLDSTLEIPRVDLHTQIGGYQSVKNRLQREILDVLTLREAAKTAAELERLETLIPRGMIFWGPPGTGKTLFAKAIATALGAALTIVSGPELKSRYVGESEEKLRLIFHRARQSAPAIIVFDELDSFASARGNYTGSGVEHSMVNQLLTEMDGFHSDELVFVIGTTNFVESLDPALLRPGRFEFQLEIPHPAEDDRREILDIYNRQLDLQFDDDAFVSAVRRTRGQVPGALPGTRFTGDHLFALCRTIARQRLRNNRNDATTSSDIDTALFEWVPQPRLSPREQQVLATHEAGHFLCALSCDLVSAVERLRLGDHVLHVPPKEQLVSRESLYAVGQVELEEFLTILMGGREAEQLLLGTMSLAAAEDFTEARGLAELIVDRFRMLGEESPFTGEVGEARPPQKRTKSAERNERIHSLLERACGQAQTMLAEQKQILLAIRDLLLEGQVIEAATIRSMRDR